MATRTTETGTLAADAIGDLFDEVSGGRGADNGDAVWDALVGSEWPSAAHADAGPEDTLDLRAIQEIARVTGRYASATPIASTLLASTWFRDRELPADRAILIALPRDGGSVALDAVDGALLVTADGIADAPAAARVDRFAPTSATAAFEGVTPVEGERLAQTRAVLAAVAVGCADAVIEKSASWAATRQQFGQPIARFQAVRHHLANMHMAREQAWTAAIVAGIETGTDRWATMALRLARRAIDLGIQVHGGVGFTVEVGLDVYLKRVLEIESVVGGGS
jgi:hypothetical protein